MSRLDAMSAARRKLAVRSFREVRHKLPMPYANDLPPECRAVIPGHPKALRRKKVSSPSASTPRRAVADYGDVEVSFFLAVKPLPKQRARHSSRGGVTRTYTPKATARHEADIQDAATVAMRGRAPFSFPVELEVTFVFAGDPGAWPTARHDGDLDNLAKAVFDGMNRVVFVDDRLVVRTSLMKTCGDENGITIRARAALTPRS